MEHKIKPLDEGELLKDLLMYKQFVGCLSYLIINHLDINCGCTF